MLPVEEAVSHILSKAKTLKPETVAIEDTQHRALSTPIRSSMDMPPFDNSAMDGIAIRFEDRNDTLVLQGTIACGSKRPAPLNTKHAYKIMTGAPLPEGADTVVAKEDILIENDTVTVQCDVRHGQHIRQKGSDIKENDFLFDVGTKIDVGVQALLASLGNTHIQSYSVPKVAVLSTGDELVHYSQTPKWGQIRNTNNLLLCNLIRSLGIEPTDLGSVGDNLPDTVSAIKRGLEFDVIITTGGVSVGEFDFVKQAIEEAKIQLEFWKVAMKPGKPVVYGSHPNGSHFFGLPGNPGSAFVAFSLFLRPFLRKLSGQSSPIDQTIQGVLNQDYTKKPGRSHFLRAQLDTTTDTPVFDISGPQGSGSLLSLCDVDALVHIPAELLAIDKKTMVKAILLK